MSRFNQKLSVIVPAYNKDAEVFASISSYVFLLKTLPYDWEIIVVDDASQDQTLREAIRSKMFNGNTRRIKIFSYDLNQGKGFALYYGFTKSSGDIVIFADSDLDLPAQNIPIILKHFHKSNSDITVGSKRHPLSKVNYPLSRRILSKSYQLLVRSLFSMNISDSQVGMKVFKRCVLEDSFPRIVIKKFAFDVELLVVAQMIGFGKISESPITLDYRFTSTIHLSTIWKIFIDTLAIFYRKNILKYYQNPKYYFSQQQNALSHFKAYV